MGELVMFRRSSSAASRLGGPSTSQGAEIVFFTGVRYERPAPAMAEASEPPPEGGLNGAGGGRRKRRA
ncbi:MAG TPA: hypothetical protein VEC58_04370 [Roseiarcus sp.]|jgi:hypothetical protein|nr:hypothetical protein [Roseiarcus sp.]